MDQLLYFPDLLQKWRQEEKYECSKIQSIFFRKRLGRFLKKMDWIFEHSPSSDCGRSNLHLDECSDFLPYFLHNGAQCIRILLWSECWSFGAHRSDGDWICCSVRATVYEQYSVSAIQDENSTKRSEGRTRGTEEKVADGSGFTCRSKSTQNVLWRKEELKLLACEQNLSMSFMVKTTKEIKFF